MGGYMSCDMRAALDRLIEEGRMPDIRDKSMSPYADLGTCIHYTLQDGLRCTWPKTSAEHKYTELQLLTAAELFSNDLQKTLNIIQRTAAYAAGFVPKSPDGKPWKAEHKFITPVLSGTIDFLSEDHTVIGDLKTTSRKPKNNKAKYPHVIQMVCYHLLTGAKSGWILYVDASGASWNTLVEIDFTTDAMQELAQQVAAYAKYLRSVHLAKIAVPRMGDHCEDNFCPYRLQCRDRFQPKAGVHNELSMPLPVAKTLTARQILQPIGSHAKA